MAAGVVTFLPNVEEHFEKEKENAWLGHISVEAHYLGSLLDWLRKALKGGNWIQQN